MVNELIFDNLSQYTDAIKKRENMVVYNFLDIGKMLKEIRDSQIYENDFNTFEDYIESNFTFKRRHAYNFIKVFEEFGNVQVLAQIGFWRCLQILMIEDSSTRELLKEELAKPEPDLVSVDKTILASQELASEMLSQTTSSEEKGILTNEPLLHVPESVNNMRVSDRVEMLDRALSYLDAELDNVFSGLSKLQPQEFKKEYSGNKDYYKSTFDSLDTKLLSVATKLRKAKVIVSRLKKYRR